MKNISIKLKKQISGVKDITLVNNHSRGLFLNTILWSLGAMTLLYLFFLINMVSNIVERRSLEATARTLASEVSTLELSYLSMSNNIDLPLSYSLGFKETKATFATRKSLGFNSAIVNQNDL